MFGDDYSIQGHRALAPFSKPDEVPKDGQH